VVMKCIPERTVPSMEPRGSRPGGFPNGLLAPSFGPGYVVRTPDAGQ
jgi:hypothetical protein